jgi:hypothetical protein
MYHPVLGDAFAVSAASGLPGARRASLIVGIHLRRGS